MPFSLSQSIRTALFTFCTFLYLVPEVRADVPTLRSENNSVWLSAGSSLLSYKEPNITPTVFDSEHGWMPSIAGGVSVMGTSNWFASLDGSVSFGSVHYNGFLQNTQTFQTTPYQGNTHETISTVDGKIGYGIFLGDTFLLTPYGELGFRYWDRNLGGGQVEDYNNLDGMGGLMLQFSPISRVVLMGYGSAGFTINPEMKSDGTTYKLVDSAMYKVGGKIGFNVTPRWEIFTTLDYDHFRYGKSPVEANGFYEPNSRTEETTSRVGVGYHFK